MTHDDHDWAAVGRSLVRCVLVQKSASTSQRSPLTHRCYRAMAARNLSACSSCQPEGECCSAIDLFQDGNEGLLVPDHVESSLFATRLSRATSRSSDRERDIPLMTPEGPSRGGSRSSSRAVSPVSRQYASKFQITKIPPQGTTTRQSNAGVDSDKQAIKLTQRGQVEATASIHNQSSARRID